MKTTTLLSILTVILVSGSFTVATALPVGNSNIEREYLTGVDDLSTWSCGLRYTKRSRDIVSRGNKLSFESNRPYLYIGYQLTHWYSAYGFIGSSETSAGAYPSSDGGADFGGGFTVNLLDTGIPSRLLLEDRLRITTSIQYASRSADWAAANANWFEISGSLLFHLVNDVEGNKLFHPDSIAIYVGPIFEELHGVNASGINRFNEDSVFGLAAGLEIFLSDIVSVDFGVESFGSTGFNGGINIRF